MSWVNMTKNMVNVAMAKMNNDNVYKGFEPQFKEALEMKNALPEQREAIKNDPNLTSEQKEAQLKGLDEVEKQIDMALDFTTRGAKFDTNSGSIAGDKDMGAILHCLTNAKAGLEKMEAAVGAAAANSQTQVNAPSHSCGGGGTNNVGGAGISSSQIANMGTSKSGEFDNLIKLSNSNPDKFIETMMGMDPERRMLVMQEMNRKLQEMNQMFSMMSNMSKAQHDTAKALIGNMRV